VTSPELSSLEWREAAYVTAFWYAAYTCANHEKRVADHLAGRGVEYFLPLYETVHRWKDRRVRLQLPLFPGYVFVRLPLAQRLRVLQAPGVARLVGFGDMPAPLADADIEALRKGLQGKSKCSRTRTSVEAKSCEFCAGLSRAWRGFCSGGKAIRGWCCQLI